MKTVKFIKIEQLCDYYQIPNTFFAELEEYGLLNSDIYNDKKMAVREDFLGDLEKIMRLHYDLNINMEGIDTVLNLLEKIEKLEKELAYLKKHLELYAISNK